MERICNRANDRARKCDYCEAVNADTHLNIQDREKGEEITIYVCHQCESHIKGSDKRKVHVVSIQSKRLKRVSLFSRLFKRKKPITIKIRLT